jgi:hypothetical protein
MELRINWLGPFAFCYYHHQSNALYFARDRIGRRSLLMSHENERFCLSSIYHPSPCFIWSEVKPLGMTQLNSKLLLYFIISLLTSLGVYCISLDSSHLLNDNEISTASLVCHAWFDSLPLRALEDDTDLRSHFGTCINAGNNNNNNNNNKTIESENLELQREFITDGPTDINIAKSLKKKPQKKKKSLEKVASDSLPPNDVSIADPYWYGFFFLLVYLFILCYLLFV